MKSQNNVKHNIYTDHIKNMLDTALSFLGLILLSPVFLIISVAIFIDDPGPIMFKQKTGGSGNGKNDRYRQKDRTSGEENTQAGKQLEDAQEQYQRLIEEKKETDKKKLFAAYQKSRRSLDEVIDFLKGKADI